MEFLDTWKEIAIHEKVLSFSREDGNIDGISKVTNLGHSLSKQNMVWRLNGFRRVELMEVKI